jgi:tripartite motif-containing protein 71
MSTRPVRALAGVLSAAAVLAGVPAAHADAPPPAVNDLVPALTFGSAQLGTAVAVERTATGDVLVADDDNNVIARFASEGTFKGSFNGSASGTPFNKPEDIATDAAGNIYVGDFQNKRVVKFDAGGTYLATISGPPANPLGAPGGLTVRGSTLYVADSQFNDVKTFSLNGAFKSSFGGPGTGPGEFQRPFGIGVADDGDIYVVDGNGQRVEVFDAAGPTRANSAARAPGPGSSTPPPA